MHLLWWLTVPGLRCMSLVEFHLFSAYLYLFGNKCVKSKLSIFPVFLMPWNGDIWHTFISTEHTQLKQHNGLVQSNEMAILKDYSKYHDWYIETRQWNVSVTYGHGSVGCGASGFRKVLEGALFCSGTCMKDSAECCLRSAFFVQRVPAQVLTPTPDASMWHWHPCNSLLSAINFISFNTWHWFVMASAWYAHLYWYHDLSLTSLAWCSPWMKNIRRCFGCQGAFAMAWRSQCQYLGRPIWCFWHTSTMKDNLDPSG